MLCFFVLLGIWRKTVPKYPDGRKNKLKQEKTRLSFLDSLENFLKYVSV